MNGRRWVRSIVLTVLVVASGGVLGAWKYASIQYSAAAAMNQPEPMETVMVARAKETGYRPTITSVGTVLALHSITLRNELPGTVRHVALTSGEIVEAGTILVALDVSVEQAELRAQEAQAALAKTVLDRRQSLRADLATAQEEVDRARADRDVALAQIERTKAVIARKTIRAPFRARVGIADLHPGQYLNEGSFLTTLQGVDDAVHIDFTVAQQIAAGLHVGETVDVSAAGQDATIPARIVAIDARIDPATRTAAVRARIDGADRAPAPGASVRVRVPVGGPRGAVTIPVSALRKGPGGDQVFVVTPGQDGRPRAHVRPVETGAMVGDEAVIYAGLSPGEEVAASGSFKLREDVLVAVANAAIGPPSVNEMGSNGAASNAVSRD